MKIPDDVMRVLAASRVEDNLLFLPQQLDRKLYGQVNKILAAIGGKWRSAAKAHVFANSPEETIQQIILTGEFFNTKKEYQFFPTPDPLARELVRLADLQPGWSVIEPSAGQGNIARHIPGCRCIELMPENRRILSESGFQVIHDDFMTFEGTPDAFVANPPFCNQQDIDHITRMIRLARHRVVAVASAVVLWRDNAKTCAFRELVAAFGGSITELPPGAFKESGTQVRTVVVSVRTDS